MTDETVLYDREGPVAIVTLNRPDRLNAMTPESLESVARLLEQVAGDDEVRAVFTTHDVVAKGSGLAPLLSDLAAQHVTRLKEPARAERFAHVTGAHLTELYVRKAEQTDRAES